MAHNRGIIHIAFRQGGEPMCRNRNAHMSTTVDRLVDWDRVCIRCQRVHQKTQAAKARKEARLVEGCGAI